MADTWGVSLRREWSRRFWFGAAYNEVRDGVADPELGQQAKEGDRAFISGFRYKTETLYAAATLATFNNHELDDQGQFYGGLRVELYADWEWTEKLLLRGALSWLRPRGHPGEYRILSLTPALRYTLTRRIGLHFTARLDASTNSDGSDRGADVFAASVFYGF